MSLAKLLIASQKVVITPTDSNFKYVNLLVHGNGSNNANNNSFNGSAGATNYTLTAVGSPTAGSFSPYGSNWAVHLPTPSTASYLTYGASTSASPGSQAFTMEAWVKFDTLPTTTGTNGEFGIIQKGRGGTSNYEFGWSLILNASSTGYQMSFQVSSNGTTIVNVNSSNLSGFAAGQWNHFAITQTAGSGVVNYWFNGVNISSSNTGVGTIFSGTGAVAIGNNNNGSNNIWMGYISNLRVVYGSVLYSSTFTPSTSPLTAVAGTSFLGCQSNRFIDTSTSAWAITVNGTPAVRRFNPFGDNATPYTTGTYGGSLFQGITGNDYLTGGPTIIISGDFTIEGWVYYIGTGVTLISQWVAGTPSLCSYIFGIRGNGSGNLFFSYGQGSTTTQVNGSSVAVVANAWNHIAVTRSGSTVRFFINGVLDSSTATISGSLNNSTSVQEIGSQSGTSSTTTQYLSDVRIVNGTAQYTASFSPPTAPLTNVTNTVFQYKAIDSSIFDNAMQQLMYTSGNAKVSTTQQKFGNGSLSFDGTSSTYLRVPNYQLPVWGPTSTSWTIEGWIYPTASGGGIFSQGTTGGSNAAINLSLSTLALQLQYSTNGTAWTTVTASTSSLTTSTWNHFAVVNNAGSLTYYIAGTAAGTGTLSGTIFASTAHGVIGSTATSGGTTLTAFLQDLRVTYGIARYTTNFTPPTATFPNQ